MGMEHDTVPAVGQVQPFADLNFRWDLAAVQRTDLAGKTAHDGHSAQADQLFYESHVPIIFGFYPRDFGALLKSERRVTPFPA